MSEQGTIEPIDLYRRDQMDGISPPNLADESSYAEHVVHARGKRTRFTSVSIDPARIRDFGPQLWKANRPSIAGAGHEIVDHPQLLEYLRAVVREGAPEERELAARALLSVRRRAEGLIDWRFEHATVERKDLLEWASRRVRPYFSRVKS